MKKDRKAVIAWMSVMMMGAAAVQPAFAAEEAVIVEETFEAEEAFSEESDEEDAMPVEAEIFLEAETETFAESEEQQDASKLIADGNDSLIISLVEEEYPEEEDFSAAYEEFLSGNGENWPTQVEEREGAQSYSFASGYGGQLGEVAEKVYKALEAEWSSNTEKIYFALPEEKQFSFTATDDTYTEKGQEATNHLFYYVQPALEAFRYDHPEVFWLKNVTISASVTIDAESLGMSDNGQASDRQKLCRITGFTIFGQEYYDGAKTDSSRFGSALQQAYGVLDSKIRTASSEAMKYKVLHDYVAQATEYQDTDAGNSAAGVLLYHQAVCEGYAKLFKILCDHYGLPCALVAGEVNQNGSSYYHMWNIVLCNGMNYAVDVTWDDGTQISGDYLLTGANLVGDRSVFGVFTEGDETYSKRFAPPLLGANDTLHEWKVTVDTAASCLREGKKEETCQLCAQTITSTKGKTGHSSYVEKTTQPDCVNAGVKEQFCGVCGSRTGATTLPATGKHRFTGWVLSEAATVYAKGKEIRECENCGLTESRDTSAVTAIGSTLLIELSEDQFTYTGKKITPAVTVMAVISGEEEEISSSYYTVTYLNNKNSGQAQIKVQGKGPFAKCSGSASFKILPKTVNFTKLTNKKKQTITLNWKKTGGAAKYEVQFSTAANFKKAKTVSKTFAGSKKTCTIKHKNLKKGKVIYVRVRGLSKNKVAGAWSHVRTIKIAK